MHQHLAVTVRIDILSACRLVRRNMHIHQPHLAIADLRVTIAQVDAAGSDGFDLGPGQDDARFVSFVNVIIVIRFPIGRQYLSELSHADFTCLWSGIGLPGRAVDRACSQDRRALSGLQCLA